jgi:glycosyltransferase involved in cell wall biosynthesis
MKKRVILFADYYLPGVKGGGPIVSIQNLFAQLKKQSTTFGIVGDRDWGDSRAYLGLKIDEWTIIDEQERLFYTNRYTFSLRKLITLFREVNPHISIANSIYSPLTRILLCAYYLGFIRANLFIAVRGELSEEAQSNKKIVKKTYLQAVKFLGVQKRVTFISTSGKETIEIKKQFGSGSRIILLPNLPKDFNLSLGTGKNLSQKVSFLFVGRIDPIKNLEFLLEAFERVKSLDFTFGIYGPIINDKYWQKCLQIISRINKENQRVSYFGILKPQDQQNVFSNYKFFVQPSKTENFGHSIFEALSLGLPSLISNNTPWKELEKFNIGFDLPLKIGTWVFTIDRCINMTPQQYDNMALAAVNFAKSQRRQIMMDFDRGVAKILELGN